MIGMPMVDDHDDNFALLCINGGLDGAMNMLNPEATWPLPHLQMELNIDNEWLDDDDSNWIRMPCSVAGPSLGLV